MAEPVTGTERPRSRHAASPAHARPAHARTAQAPPARTAPGLSRADEADPSQTGPAGTETAQARPSARSSQARGSQARGSRARGSQAPGSQAWDTKARDSKARDSNARGKGHAGKSAVDAWMQQEVTIRGRTYKRQRIAQCLVGFPVLFPLLFMLPAVITFNSDVLNNSVADVLGSGAEACLLLALLITPLATVTRQRWFVPMRRWFGIMMAVTAITDATIASLTTDFAGGIVGRIAGHSFLLAGLMMVVIAIPLLAIANNRAQKWLGKYWKPLQRMTYVIWGLLYIHLALLFGFGLDSGSPDDGDPFFHDRLVQLTACSIPLLLLRLPPVRRWVTKQQRAGRQWLVYTAGVPLALMFLLGFVFIVNEEIFKGVATFTLHPIQD